MLAHTLPTSHLTSATQPRCTASSWRLAAPSGHSFQHKVCNLAYSTGLPTSSIFQAAINANLRQPIHRPHKTTKIQGARQIVCMPLSNTQEIKIGSVVRLEAQLPQDLLQLQNITRRRYLTAKHMG